MKKKLFIKTFGCQMNIYDSDRMVDALIPLGFDITESPDSADMAILNTCHIREKASEKVFSDLGRLRKIKDKKRSDGKDLMIAVTGCVAQAEGDVITRRAPFVDIVMGPQTYHKIPEIVAKTMRGIEKKTSEERKPGMGVIDVDFPLESKFDHLPEITQKQGVSAFLSIQEGCNKFCTFCVVPYTRGAEYSRDVEMIVKEAKNLVSLGAREITLLGQNVNAYHGLSNGKERNLAYLIEKVAEVDGVERIRYTTSHPKDMDDDLYRVHGECEKLMPFLHLPVQSGSDKVLKLMQRRHTRDDYYKIIDRLRENRPDIALSSDFITGFPGETAEDFEQTMELVEHVKFAQAFSFKYSPRPGTPAALHELQVREDDKLARLHRLQELLKAQQLDFNQTFVGRTEPVLIERIDNDYLVGRTPYLQLTKIKKLSCDGKDSLGKIVNTKIEKANSHSLEGIRT